MSEGSRRAREMLGLPVFAVADGQRLGQVNRLLVRREERSVAAVGISEGNSHQVRHLPFSRIKTVGPDAVMVEDAAALEWEIPAEEAQGLDSSLPGRPVVTAGGQRIGEIAGFEVNVSSGRIEAFRIRPDTGAVGRLAAMVKDDTVRVPGTMAVSLGKDALIVRDEAASLGQRESRPVDESGPADPDAGTRTVTVVRSDAAEQSEAAAGRGAQR